MLSRAPVTAIDTQYYADAVTVLLAEALGTEAPANSICWLDARDRLGNAMWGPRFAYQHKAYYNADVRSCAELSHWLLAQWVEFTRGVIDGQT